ncbi:LuxR C-terminal-related transcriptional regulator [Actinophytocola sp.]|uniref:helix-turn-helix transcriptional regulator n=1 Tax=Actinophytocola sp. TaxID=1872138 RepID=UPI003899947C
MGDRWPLVGRLSELQAIDAVVRQAGGGRGVVLAGAAGVGKTRLARAALANARRDGVLTRWVAGSESARTVPLGAFASVLPSVGSDPFRALGQASGALLAGAGQQGALVVVDDAHLLDELSATLVHQLAVGAAATVVLTVRTGEPAPDAVTAVWKDAYLDRLEVAPLTRAETGMFLEAVLGGPVEMVAATRMWRLSRGNALYLRELVVGERDAGRLTDLGGVWRWSGQPALSPKLVELVESRMGTVLDPAREVVDLLAFAGPLGVDVLGRLVDNSALESAETAGLVEVEADGQRLTTGLAHPLYGEVRRAATGVLRARGLRGRIATALLDTGARRADDELRCAALMLDSDLTLDPDLLSRAAGRSAQLLDLPLAVRLALAAVAAGAGFAARAIVAQSLTMQGWGAEAEAELRVLAELADTDVERAWVAAMRAGNMFLTLNDPATGDRLLTEALTAIPNVGAREILWALRSVFDSHLARPADARRAATVVLDAPCPQPISEFAARWGLTGALGLTGHADEVEAVASRAYLLANTFDTAVLRFNLAEFELLAYRLAGYLAQADAVAARCRDEAAEMPGVPLLFAAALTGHAELARGHLRDAVRWLREALAGFTVVDPAGRVFDCLLWLTQALATAGDTDAARRALADMEANRHHGFVYREPEVLLARATVAAAQGALSKAVALAREAAGTARAAGLAAYEVQALQTAVRFGDHGTAARLAELAVLVDGPRARTAAAHAAALAERDGLALHAVSLEWERMGDLIAAADAAAQAAAAHDRWNHAARPRTDAGRAHRLAEACQGARTPAIRAAARPLPITAREREIVGLAGGGLSNRDIAERLGVSVRTVEGHLYRAAAKLGVTRRADFAELLGNV